MEIEPNSTETQEMDNKTSLWVKVAKVEDWPTNGGRCFKYGGEQIAIFRFDRKKEWYATQNLCPHKQEMVISRGLLGDDNGTPKVACPLHKNTFSLESGEHLNGEVPKLKTYEIKIVEDTVMINMAPI